jgi:hypothetical protein
MKKKLAIVFGLVLVLVAAIIAPVVQNRDRLHAKARKQWKESAIAEVARRTADSNWLASEARTLKKTAETESDSDSWLSDHLMLMKNGEWIAYASKCSKEDGRIRDIFIGRGSDGEWYYSTYHFCIGMVVLRMADEQPESLAKFVETYSLRDFDARSDECLEKTWPPKRR